MLLGVERPGTQIVRGQLSKYGVWGLKGDVILANCENRGVSPLPGDAPVQG